MQSRSTTISWAVLLMATCSLFSMLGTFKVDEIVNRDLYKYGLQFSYAWATPYWNTTGFVFAMGWLNIVVALIVEVRLLAIRRKALKQTASQAKKETTPAKVAEEQKEEKLKPAETRAQTKEPQAVVVSINTQEKEEKPIEVTETPQVKPQSDQVKERAEQNSSNPEESEAQQEETESEPPEANEETPVVSQPASP
jgi:hypothetical protein